MGIPDLVARDDLKFPSFVPGVPAVLQKKGADMFKVIRKSDVLLHHPYQSFKPVIDFIQQAASDPNVVAIKQTVYRTGADSALMDALIAAADVGKEVTVVVELLARFDEEANINWASTPGRGRRACGVWRGRPQDPRQDADGGAARRTASCAATCISAPATIIRAPRGSTPTSACSPPTRNVCADVNEVFSQLTSLGKAGKLRPSVAIAVLAAQPKCCSAIRNETSSPRQASPRTSSPR